MINVLILKEEEKIVEISVDGHANYAKEGFDIVCAGVSAVVIGGINAIDTLDDNVVFDVSTNEDSTGHITYRSINSTYEEQLLLKSIVVSLQSIEENYSKYISIETREVK